MDTVPQDFALLFVHGACVRGADWWWSHMTQSLAKLGVPTVAVALPSCGETVATPTATLHGAAEGDRVGDRTAEATDLQESVRGQLMLVDATRQLSNFRDELQRLVDTHLQA